jgi:TolB-like protein
MSGFFEEVKRRKVYRVAAAYVIAGGGMIQLASAAFPAWELPNWALRLVIVLLLIGFPIALILAWAFDVTPAGIKATPSSPSAAGSGRRRNIIMLVSTGVLVSAVAGFFLLQNAAAHKIDKSIAVLPFENLSDDKENAYFADGIQDDVLTNLARIGDLKVISRTSVMGYRGKPSSVREIGKALGVSAILEGTVRKDRNSNRVRVNVQLINAENDEHIWAQEYDRDVTDMFAIQTDLAQKIADELQAKLSPTEKAQLMRKPTENAEAYLAYVQARNLSVPEDFNKLKESEQLYERALQLDPNFALAAAGLSYTESWIFHTHDPLPARQEKARALAERALQLQPDLPEAHLARGFAYYYGSNDYDSALREFATAQRGLPNAAEAYLAIGAIQRRQGRWAESTANLEKAASLNPKDAWPLQNLFFNYDMTRNFDAAQKTLDRALELDPKSFTLSELKAKLAIDARGDVSVGVKMVEAWQGTPMDPTQMETITNMRVYMLIFQRRFAEALTEAAKLPEDQHGGEGPAALSGKHSIIGAIKKKLKDETGAREALLQAKGMIEAQIQTAPANPSRHCQYALVLAWLGEKNAALAATRRALELLPESKDAFGGPDIAEAVAQVYGLVGEKDMAFTLLDHLLSEPSSVTVFNLKLNPLWDPLRDDARFPALLEKYGGKA